MFPGQSAIELCIQCLCIYITVHENVFVFSWVRWDLKHTSVYYQQLSTGKLIRLYQGRRIYLEASCSVHRYTQIYALHLVLRKLETRRRSIHVPSVFGTLIILFTVICIYNQFNPNVWLSYIFIFRYCWKSRCLLNENILKYYTDQVNYFCHSFVLTDHKEIGEYETFLLIWLKLV